MSEDLNVTTITVSAMNLRDRVGDILNQVYYGGGRFIVERRGEAVAAIISVEELRRLERVEQEREEEMMRLARLAAVKEGVVPFQTLVEQYQRLHGEPLEIPDHG